MLTSCHILVEGNPVIIYASRNGSPNKGFTHSQAISR
jgi:hypothetical protein